MQTLSSFILLADAAAPAQNAPSSAVGVAIVILVFAICFALAVRAAIRHFKGEGGCCGDCAGPSPAQDKQIGTTVAEVELVIDGMHCMKCVARVKAALEAIPGVAAEVTLETQAKLTAGYGLAVVRMDREVPDADLRKAVEDQGFRVVSIS